MIPNLLLRRMQRCGLSVDGDEREQLERACDAGLITDIQAVTFRSDYRPEMLSDEQRARMREEDARR